MNVEKYDGKVSAGTDKFLFDLFLFLRAHHVRCTGGVTDLHIVLLFIKQDLNIIIVSSGRLLSIHFIAKLHCYTMKK
jgi:hypothetical protein